MWCHSTPHVADVNRRPHTISKVQSSGTSSTAGDCFSKSKHGRAESELRILPTDHKNRLLLEQGEQNQAVIEELGAKLGGGLEDPVLSGTEPFIDLHISKPRASDNELDAEVKPMLSGKVPDLDPMHIGGNIDDSEDEPLTLVTPDIVESDDSKRPDCVFTCVSLEELVDRLLSPLMSKSDAKFISTFLCLYRKFAAPSELVTAIISRFRNVSESQEAHILRVTSQLRYLGVLAHWVSGYPGDFAHPRTRQIATQFLSGLGNTRIFAAARAEMSKNLDVVVEDDDTEWACSDSGKSGAQKVTTVGSISSITNPLLPQFANPIKQDVLGGADLGDLSKHHVNRHSATLSTTSSLSRSDSQSSTSHQTRFDPVERARRQAHFLAPTPKICLAKAEWHRLMDIPVDDIARELTRIDWIMYSSIRPRDLVRHVTLSTDERYKCKSLENVDRMINHFNHVAFWVANLVLLRDKPKHRARILERFMRIAWVSYLTLSPMLI